MSLPEDLKQFAFLCGSIIPRSYLERVDSVCKLFSQVGQPTSESDKGVDPRVRDLLSLKLALMTTAHASATVLPGLMILQKIINAHTSRYVQMKFTGDTSAQRIVSDAGELFNPGETYLIDEGKLQTERKRIHDARKINKRATQPKKQRERKFQQKGKHKRQEKGKQEKKFKRTNKSGKK